eukprot:TRINITY_DN31847_c0_g1_i1.p1 TRINITY_DN31847_c0_g1~~TRINITY_DN31847_c0_g1_i1.p1  ORF type:complete len:193 (-),score=48.29 TRINITY_DN31847_c0_g1_i1:41-544(-)
MADDNPNPVVYDSGIAKFKHRSFQELLEPESDGEDPVTDSEVFESIRFLSDPEHPNLSLEQLKVVAADHVKVDGDLVFVRFTPTVPTCSVATLIGLTIKAKLSRSLPRRFKVDVEIEPGTHNQEDQVNKQLQDKERVCAALENPALRNLINRGILDTDKAYQTLQLV